MEAVLQNSALLPLLLPTSSRPSLYPVSIPQTLSLSFSSSLFPPRFPIHISSRSHSLPGFFSHPSRNSRPFHVSASAVAVQKTGKDRSPVDVLVTETKEPNSSVRLSVEVPPAVCQQCYRKVIDEFARQAKIPGFRPGKKVPENILVNYIGRNNVQQAAIEATLKKTLPQAMASLLGPTTKEGGTPIEFQGGLIRYRDQSSLRILRGSNTWYQSRVLSILLLFHLRRCHSVAHHLPKQFP
ncbi:hypothetical protein GW17_00022225 [Ensete ventricosum]|nr:hypothetical protein GW17_00022225 [Ensete ventricosum]